jgi:hypothetical protein
VPVLRPKGYLPTSGVQRPTHRGYDVASISYPGNGHILYKEYVFLGDYDDGFDSLLLILEFVSGSLQAPLSVNVPDSFWSITGPEMDQRVPLGIILVNVRDSLHWRTLETLQGA